MSYQLDLDDVVAGNPLAQKELATLRADLTEARGALELIADIAFDRDGYTGNADKLGELIDEIYRYAKDPKSAYLVVHPEARP